MKHLESAPETIAADFAQDLRSGSAATLAGAGISMPSPSSLPSGTQLRDIVLSELFTKAPFNSFFLEMTTAPNYHNIVPEVLFSAVFHIIGSRLYLPFQILRAGQPNFVHRSLGYLSGEFGMPLFTTNFDVLLELAGPQRACIFHLHGLITRPSSMTLLLEDVARPQPPPHSAFFKSLSGKNLYVFGYSGNDRDIMLLIRETNFNRIYWMIRSEDDQWTMRNLGEIDNEERLVPFVSDVSDFFHLVMKVFPGFNCLADSLNILNLPPSNAMQQYREKVIDSERFLVLALLLYRMQQYEKAYWICATGLARADVKPAHKARMAIYLAELGRMLNKQAAENLAGLNEFLASGRRSFLYGEALNSKGIILMEQEGKNTEAVQYFNRGEAILAKYEQNERSPHRKKAQKYRSMLRNNMGLALYNEGEYEKAYMHFLTAARAKRKNGDALGEASSLSNLGLAAYAMGKIEKFSMWERKAFAVMRKYGLFNREVSHLKDTGELMLRRGETKGGIKRLQMARRLARERIGGGYKDLETLEKLIEDAQRTELSR